MNTKYVIWTYGGLPLDDLPKGDKAKERLFKEIGFEFKTARGNFDDGNDEWISVGPAHPMQDPVDHIKNEVGKIVELYGKPYAIILTNVDGGSNFASVGNSKENLRYYPPENTIRCYQEIAENLGIPLFRVTREQIWGEDWNV